MLELAALTFVFYLFFNRKRKEKRPKGFDAEVAAIFDRADYESGVAREIKTLLFDVINDDAKALEKFSDHRIAQAQRIIDNAGPASLYWMCEIAAQLATLSAAQINGIPTNINFDQGETATPEAVVNAVIRE